jgi:hypothetical protein
MLAACYDLLRETKPFKGWRLPPSAKVKFSVTRHKDRAADYTYENGVHHIRVSANRNAHLASVLASVAHEAAHLRQRMVRPEERGEHGAEFHRAAKAICAAHGWDPKAF